MNGNFKLGRNGESGSLTAFFVFFSVVFLALFSLVIDGTRYLLAERHAVQIAMVAARLGAQEIDQNSLRNSTVSLNADAAINAATQYLTSKGYQGSVSTNHNEVVVDVRGVIPTYLMTMFGIQQIRYNGIGYSQLVNG